MQDGKGYLLPENPIPETLRCLKVWIPDDPRYLEAFSGQFHDLATWLVWEKDGTNKGSLAASAWKNAVDYTYENGWLNCGDDVIQDILTRLEELENMNINVNCGCGCGCKGGSTGTVDTTFDPTQNYPVPPPFPGTNEPIGIVSWRCDAAHQLHDDWLTFVTEMAALGTVGIISVTALAEIAALLAVITGGVALLLMLVATLAVGGATGILGWVRDWLEQNGDDLICTIMESSSPAEAHANVVGYIEANKDDPFGSFAGNFIGTVLRGMADDTNWNLLYTPDSMEIAPTNFGSDCSNCSPQGQFDLVSFSDFDDTEGNEPTQIAGGTFYEGGYVRMTIAAASGSSTPVLRISRLLLEQHLGINIVGLHIDYIAFDLTKSTVNGTDYDKTVDLKLMDDTGFDIYWTIEANTIPTTQPSYTRYEITPNVDIAFPSGDSTIWFQIELEKIGNLGGIHIDNLEIRGDITTG